MKNYIVLAGRALPSIRFCLLFSGIEVQFHSTFGTILLSFSPPKNFTLDIRWPEQWSLPMTLPKFLRWSTKSSIRWELYEIAKYYIQDDESKSQYNRVQLPFRNALEHVTTLKGLDGLMLFSVLQLFTCCKCDRWWWGDFGFKGDHLGNNVPPFAPKRW